MANEHSRKVVFFFFFHSLITKRELARCETSEDEDKKYYPSSHGNDRLLTGSLKLDFAGLSTWLVAFVILYVFTFIYTINLNLTQEKDIHFEYLGLYLDGSTIILSYVIPSLV